jgi:tRNA threonylcarbamoyladenosine biosynthesis protein TsaE
MKLISESLARNLTETEQAILPILETVSKGDVILLNGDLGSGKTFIAKAIINNLLDVEKQDVASPTFNICLQYKFNQSSNSENNNSQDPQDPQVLEIHHYDLYRLESPQQAIEAGIEDSFENALTLVEWPDIIADILPEKFYLVKIKKESDEVRKIRILSSL